MKPTVEGLTDQFKRLIGPEVLAKAEAAVAAAKAAAEAAAKAAAEKAAAAAAAAKAAASVAPATPAAATAAPAVGGPAANRPAPVPTTIAAAPAAPKPVAVPTPAKPATAAVTAGDQPAPNPLPRPTPVAAAAPTPAPVPAPIPTLPVQATAHAAKGYDFDALVAPNQIVEAVRLLDQQGFGIDTITGVDWIAQNEMEVVYDFFHPTETLRVVVRVRVPRATPEVPTITAVFPGANWHERETHDFFGIRFTDHPNLKPFLLPEDADFHPLRKDYQP